MLQHVEHLVVAPVYESLHDAIDADADHASDDAGEDDDHILGKCETGVPAMPLRDRLQKLCGDGD